MLSESLYFFCLFLGSINLFWIIGLIFLYNFRKNFVNQSLFNLSILTIGVTVVVVLISLIITKFKTVNLILLLIAIYIFCLYNFKKNLKIPTQIDEPFNNEKLIYFSWREVNLISILFFVIYFVLYSHGQSSFIGIPVGDTNFYTRMSSNFFKYQNETNVFYFHSEPYVAPYHYYDIWLNTFFNLFNKSALVNYVLITIPVLTTQCYFGFKTLISKIVFNQFVVTFFSLFGLFFTGLYINNFYEGSYLMDSSNVFTRNIFDLPKLIPLYIFLLWALYFLINEKLKLFYIFLSVVVICNISCALAVFGCCGLSLIYFILKKQKENIYVLFFPVLILTLIFLFYQQFSDKSEVRLNKMYDLESWFSFQKIKTSINIIVKSNIQYSLLYLIVVLLFLLNLKKNILLFRRYNFLFFVLVGLYFSGLIGWALFNQVMDSVQFFSNISVCILNIASVLFIAYSFSLNSKVKFITLTIILALCFESFLSLLDKVNPRNHYDTHTLNYINEKFMPKINNLKVAYLKSKKYLTNVFNTSSDFVIVGSQLLLLDNFEFVSLSMYDFDLSKDSNEKQFEIQSIKASPFNKYVVINKKKLNIEELKYQYIIDNKVQLLVATDDLILNTKIKKLVIDSIHDKISHEKFYLLHHF